MIQRRSRKSSRFSTTDSARASRRRIGFSSSKSARRPRRTNKSSNPVAQTHSTNCQLGLLQLLDDLMVQRMVDNDKIVTRYMDDRDFGSAAFAELSKAIYDSIPSDERGSRTIIASRAFSETAK